MRRGRFAARHGGHVHDMAARRHFEERRVESCSGNLDEPRRHGESALIGDHGGGLLHGVAEWCASAALHHDAVTAAGLAAGTVAGHRTIHLLAAGELGREVGVPAIDFHLHVRLVASVGGGLHDHGRLDVTGLVTEHVLFFAGVVGGAGDGDDAALARGWRLASGHAAHHAGHRRPGRAGAIAAHRHHHALIPHDRDDALLVALRNGGRGAAAAVGHLVALACTLDVHGAFGGVSLHGGTGFVLHGGCWA